MAKWTGFTEQELNQFRSQSSTSDDSNTDGATLKNPRTSCPRKPVSKKRITSRFNANKHQPTERSTGAAVVNPNDMNKSLNDNVNVRCDIIGNENLQNSVASPQKTSATLRVDIDSLKYEIIDNSETNSNRSPTSIITNEDEHKNADSLQKKVNLLQDFEKRQKQMEQENAKRKQLLINAIKDRQKRTVAERQKLDKIQEELNHLDLMLTNGVSILRNQIESASLEFNEAQKRYDKAEKEFVEAKLDLFSKMERKEQLTEYLCTIIEQNEIRKARKLADLMRDLEMDSLVEECKENGMGPILPQLCSLSDVSYTCCSTIKPPSSGRKDSLGRKESLVENTNMKVDSATKEVSVSNDEALHLSEKITSVTSNEEEPPKDGECVTLEEKSSAINTEEAEGLENNAIAEQNTVTGLVKDDEKLIENSIMITQV